MKIAALIISLVSLIATSIIGVFTIIVNHDLLSKKESIKLDLRRQLKDILDAKTKEDKQKLGIDLDKFITTHKYLIAPKLHNELIDIFQSSEGLWGVNINKADNLIDRILDNSFLWNNKKPKREKDSR